MSQKRKAIHISLTINKKIAGARSTTMARGRQMIEFINYCAARGIKVNDPKSITSNTLKAYAAYLRAPLPEGQGNSVGTTHNKLGAVRKFLEGQGVDLKQANLKDNKSAGLASRSRVGTKLPVSDQVFNAALARALEIGEVGFAHCMRLERFLGLRGLEAVMSSAALLQFAKEAQRMDHHGLAEVEVFDGTKGGRARSTTVIVAYAKQTLQAIYDALQFSTENGGYLITGKVSGLKAARARYHKIARDVGLTGQYSPHSLRYRYACDKLAELRDLGVPRAEAMVLASKWLGHGPGRGRWVSTVYGRTVKDTFPKATRRSSQKGALSALKALIEEFPNDADTSLVGPKAGT